MRSLPFSRVCSSGATSGRKGTVAR
jgi:hypothetical protein